MRWDIACTVWLLVGVQVVGSVIEGTLTQAGLASWARPNVSFVRHQGNWADVFLLPFIVGPIFAGVRFVPARDVWLLAAALGVTLALHWVWGQPGATGHMFPAHESPYRLLNLGTAGWAHVALMTFALWLLLVYVAAPVSARLVWQTSLLLVPFCLWAQVYCGRVITGAWFDPVTAWTFGGSMAVTWGAAAYKLAVQRPQP